MKVTVAICTWNRAQLLDRTLTQFHHLRIPADVTWELLVVNNSCSDETDSIIERHASALPVRRLFEPNPGHSNARNCAVSAADGQLMLWTDDDVLVDSDWLAAYQDAAESWPDASFFGGPVDPWYESTPPDWVVQNESLMMGPLALCHRGDVIKPLGQYELPFGCSMAFRTGILKRFPFNPALGRLREKVISGDESDAFCRMKQAGHWGVWVSTARVRHWVPQSRMTYKYAWEWYVGEGITGVCLSGPPAGVCWSGVPRWVVRLYVTHRLRAWWYRARNDRRWFHEFCHAAQKWGIMCHFREVWRRGNRPLTTSGT